MDRSIAHLRRYSNYLSPKVGFFSADTWSMFTIWLRNALLVQITVVAGDRVRLDAAASPLSAFSTGRRSATALGDRGAVPPRRRRHRRQPDSFRPPARWKLLRAKSWPLGLAAAAILAAAAWVYGAHRLRAVSRRRGRLPCGGSDRRIAGARSLLPSAGGGKTDRALWPGDDPPADINFTQAWAQWIVVVPMMATGYLVAAILWGESQAAVPAISPVSTRSAVSFTEGMEYWPFPLSVLFVSIWLLSICSVRTRKEWKGVAAAFAARCVRRRAARPPQRHHGAVSRVGSQSRDGAAARIRLGAAVRLVAFALP